MNKKELSALVDQASKGITNEDGMAEAMKFIRKSFYEKALNAELEDRKRQVIDLLVKII
jgi:FKBP-type peptidyl-prolyl cis-trans isomerase (trigger factor)